MTYSLLWFATSVRDSDKRCADFRPTSATILGEKDEKITRRSEIDGIDDGTAFAARAEQARVRKNEELGRQGVRRGGEASGDLARGQALRSGFDEEAKHLEPGLMRQRRKLPHGIHCFHNS